jgi:hypothetical protein
MRQRSKVSTRNAVKAFVLRHSSILAIVFASMLERPERVTDCSRRANSSLTRLYELPVDKAAPTSSPCDLCGRLIDGNVWPVDFETMYRPMPTTRIQLTISTQKHCCSSSSNPDIESL